MIKPCFVLPYGLDAYIMLSGELSAGDTAILYFAVENAIGKVVKK